MHAAPASAASSATSVRRRATEGVRRVFMGVDTRWSSKAGTCPGAARRIPSSGGVKLRGDRATRCTSRAIRRRLPGPPPGGNLAPMPRPRSAPDLYLLSKVSTLYYLRDQTQQEIAERLRLSRPAVSRLLRDAQTHGIVQITISPPRGLHIDLESRLEEQFGLGVVRIVPTEPGTSPDLLRRQIGAAAAAFLSRTVHPGDTIGLAWGTTLSAMVQAMAPMATDGVHVVQTLGGIGPPAAEAYAAELVRRLAQLLGAVPVLFPVPGVVATTEVRDVLRNDPARADGAPLLQPARHRVRRHRGDGHELRAQRRPLVSGRHARVAHPGRRGGRHRAPLLRRPGRRSDRRWTSASSGSRPSSSAGSARRRRGGRTGQGGRDPRRAQGGHRERADHGSGYGGGAWRGDEGMGRCGGCGTASARQLLPEAVRTSASPIPASPHPRKRLERLPTPR